MLVLIGSTEDGTKELLAVVTVIAKAPNPGANCLGSSSAWAYRPRPKLAIGDGSLGFWIALQEEYGPVPEQRCWVHKTVNGSAFGGALIPMIGTNTIFAANGAAFLLFNPALLQLPQSMQAPPIQLGKLQRNWGCVSGQEW